MDTTAYVGIGLSVTFFFLRYAVSAMPTLLAWTGVLSGALILSSLFLPPDLRPPLSAVACFAVGILALGASGYFWIGKMKTSKRSDFPSPAVHGVRSPQSVGVEMEAPPNLDPKTPGFFNNKITVERMVGPPGTKGVVIRGNNFFNNEITVKEMDFGSPIKPDNPTKP